MGRSTSSAATAQIFYHIKWEEFLRKEMFLSWRKGRCNRKETTKIWAKILSLKEDFFFSLCINTWIIILQFFKLKICEKLFSVAFSSIKSKSSSEFQLFAAAVKKVNMKIFYNIWKHPHLRLICHTENKLALTTIWKF